MITAVIVFSTAVYAGPFGAMNGGVLQAGLSRIWLDGAIRLRPSHSSNSARSSPINAPSGARGAAVELTGAKRAFLQRINFEINNEITHSNEGDDDRKVGARVGDCEDFALTKRQRLLGAGWPSGALRIATTRTESDSGHAVLVVTTSKGDLVLDKRTNIVKPWFATGLRWLKIQSRTIRGTRSRFETWRVAPGDDDNYVYAIALESRLNAPTLTIGQNSSSKEYRCIPHLKATRPVPRLMSADGLAIRPRHWTGCAMSCASDSAGTSSNWVPVPVSSCPCSGNAGERSRPLSPLMPCARN